MEERRRHQRYETLNLVYYVVRDDGELSQDMGRTLDASERGLLIETSIPLVEGLHLKMDIALGDMILNLSGEVVHTHSTDAGMHVSGVEFDPLDEKTRTLLKEFLRHFDPV
jgi:hypothetical protein